MLFEFTPDSKAALILCQLIELILQFLSAGLYRKIRLRQCNGLFSGISILSNQVACVTS